MDKVLILGINGFIGRHFQNYIVEKNLISDFSFTGVDKTEPDKFTGIKYKKIDLLDYSSFQELILEESPDYIINLTGTFNSENFELMEDINVGISRSIFKILLKKGVRIKNILLIGSAAEYGLNNNLPINEYEPLNPINPYGFSKSMQTLYALFYFNNFGINVNIARTFNLVGKDISTSLSIGSFANQIKKAQNGDTIYVGNLNTKRDFLNVEDAISAFWKILINEKKGEIYNVCSGRSYFIKDILNFLIEKSKKKLNVSVKKEYIKTSDTMDSYGDNAKLRKDTGWREENNIFTALKEMLE
ncbi:MAG: GDP-mannose 4,6-dehydratase [Candidatus Omnitrophota bacterium]|nr:GDP-mannose 4,6-dehydratase [Candidatus Omnitrophota bacterium]